MFNRKLGLLLAFATAALMLAACAPAAGSQEEEPTESPTSEVTQELTQAPSMEPTMESTEEATDAQPNGGQGDLNVTTGPAAIAALAAKLNIGIDEITLVSAEHVDWSDGCLGLGGPEEMCIQAITPGFRIILEVNGQQYEVHTDETGASIRIADELQK